MTSEPPQVVSRKASRLGDALRRERQGRNISMRQVTQATKISIRHLEALERSDFQTLPGGAFNKGFVRAYATYLGLDGEAMVSQYLLEMSRLRSEPESQTPPPPTRDERQRRRLRILVIVVGIALVAAAIAAAVWYVPRWLR